MRNISLILLCAIWLVCALVQVNASSPIRHPRFTQACYVDAFQRDLKGARESSVNMTRQRCNRFCRTRGFRFGAVQQGLIYFYYCYSFELYTKISS